MNFLMICAGVAAVLIVSATVSLAEPMEDGVAEAVVKRSKTWSDANKMADFAYTSMSTNSLTPVKLIKIAKASKQTASGVNYKLTLELAEEQNVEADAGAFQCEVIVFDQPRTNTRKLVSTSCTLKRQRRQVPGGYVPIDVNDAEVREMAAFATNVISASNHLGPVELIQIIRAASQVVAGVNYKMTLLLASKQGGSYGRRRFRCDVTVFDQPWTNTRELTQSQCFRA
ncbi:hypothetical protein GHT06_018847 [Daphnia sinensis]|uniref:Cystatin domain-containing protein n=1 Tax=Daphnia sinensis TaxID=1820382 RepID=A0AAD5PSL6_9CRUS|nr:hypothetical protein GHT06_018847 [Daphnia sinensis]